MEVLPNSSSIADRGEIPVNRQFEFPENLDGAAHSCGNSQKAICLTYKTSHFLLASCNFNRAPMFTSGFSVLLEHATSIQSCGCWAISQSSQGCSSRQLCVLTLSSTWDTQSTKEKPLITASRNGPVSASLPLPWEISDSLLHKTRFRMTRFKKQRRQV